jgi:Zn-dependent protease with chaperone function
VHVESRTDPDRQVTTSDATLVAQLVHAGARRVGLPRGRQAVVVGVSCALAVVAVFVALYAAAPWLSRRAAEHVPLTVEQRLDVRAGGIFGRTYCDTPAALSALQALERRLDPNGEIPAAVHVVNVSVPNAFSLPGGTILVTRGLVDAAQSADEVAGVLAHELAHVKHRHVLAELIESTFMSAVWGLTIGDYSGLLVVDPRTLQNLLELRHSRDAEIEADATAADLLARARVSTAGLIAFFERNRSRAQDELDFISTHPATAERLSLLRTGTRATIPELAPDVLEDLRRACSGFQEPHSLRDVFK